MKIVFNLKKAFESIRQAMAGEWLAYSKNMKWWNLQEIEDGDPEWMEFIKGNPEKGLKPNSSLVNAISDARNEYWKKVHLFRARYGVSTDEVSNFYKMYIGYSPMKGMYALGIGPYTAMPGAWKTTIDYAKKNGVPLNSQSLLELADSVPLPQLPEGFDVEDPANKKNPLTTEYKAQQSLKKRILEVRADMMNKFSYFPKTYNKIDRANMNRGVNSYLQGLIKNVGVMFDDSDLGVVIKSFPPEKVGQLEGKVGKINTEFDSIDPKDPKGEQLMSSGTLIGKGSTLMLNSRGLNKLLMKTAQDGNWQDLYEKAVEEMAKANNKPVDEMRYLVAEDDNFSNLFLEHLKAIQDELKKAGDFRAEFLNVALAKRPKPPRVGALRAQVYRISKTQKAIALTKIELLRTIVSLGTDDPEKVAQALNAAKKGHKTKAKGTYNAETVQLWLNAIKSEDQRIQKLKKKKQVRNYQEILDTAVSNFETMNENEEMRDSGQDDLASAYALASTTFMESPVEFIDPTYRTKLQLPTATNMFHKEGDADIEVTAKQMTALRLEARKKGTEEEIKKALKSEIEKEIGTKSKNIPQKGMQGELVMDADDGSDEEATDAAATVTPAPEVPEAQPELGFDVTEMPQQKTDVEPAPEAPETIETPPQEAVPAGEEDIPQPEKFDPKKLFGSTFTSLIVMARDLDAQGKSEAAEEIHKIIRKYQSRIKE